MTYYLSNYKDSEAKNNLEKKLSDYKIKNS